MTTVKVNAKKHEVSPSTRKLMAGLDISFQRLLSHRCRTNGTFCFSDEKGQIFTMKAREVKAMLEK